MEIKTTVTLDAAGRLVLPKPVRDALHLNPGDSLDLDIRDDEVRLRPQSKSQALQKEQGIWVLTTGKPLSAEGPRRWLEELRLSRDRRNAESQR